jgi:hypothetical protein
MKLDTKRQSVNQLLKCLKPDAFERVAKNLTRVKLRPVSVLVSALEKARILNVEGRWVTVADRNRLQKAACECYDIIRKTYEVVARQE